MVFLGGFEPARKNLFRTIPRKGERKQTKASAFFFVQEKKGCRLYFFPLAFPRTVQENVFLGGFEAARKRLFRTISRKGERKKTKASAFFFRAGKKRLPPFPEPFGKRFFWAVLNQPEKGFLERFREKAKGNKQRKETNKQRKERKALAFVSFFPFLRIVQE
jgi:hypothetical protein